MNNRSFYLREIKAADNSEVASTICEVFEELGVPKTGTAYEDASLHNLSEYYTGKRCKYWVVTDGERILGGGGIAPLEGGTSETCELQKMYFRKEIRGKGWGKKVLKQALEFAREQDFAYCYLETMPYMKAAQHLYRCHGFNYLDHPMGNTGHSACPVWMLKRLV